ncbi:MAG TPA: SagB/ThcOx family dehydrogenase [Candidatus Syntrophosphaera sp.]|jgi:SagB-type dehydrogenase family enzyme|nr:SagB/ThcOx family dehydrogenase [Candidatus Syntrophosphaera sp.]HPW37698.1 SagB/ThcOx family dehydrogenase [Candidatus Syntrophosphaera sp.]HQC46895.1 SagB/ThcOx family dehydrogenase [Candidatus Syntrophosphaera sp.]
MQEKTFYYLYHKARGASREQVMEAAKLSAEEYDQLEQSRGEDVRRIQQDLPRAAGIGPDFVRLTRYIYGGSSDQEQGKPCPEAVKARSGEVIQLPAVERIPAPEISLRQAISQRRSLRKYSDQPLSLEELSFMLWATSWARDFRSGKNIETTFRNVPSAGSRHPFECYLLVNNVSHLAAGLYWYHPLKHGLVSLEESDDIADHVLDGCMGQEMVVRSAVTFILCARPYRAVWRYQQRSYRYLYVDAGHWGQNIHLAAEAVGAGACMVGAFMDEKMNACLGLDGEEEFVIYVAPVGKK